MGLKADYLSQFLTDINQALRGEENVDMDSLATTQALAKDLVHTQSYLFDHNSAEVLSGILKETKGGLEKLPWPRLPFESLFMELPNTDPEGLKYMKTIGLLISPVSANERSVVVLGRTASNALARPMVQVTFDRDGDYNVDYLPGGQKRALGYFKSFGIDENRAKATAAKNAIELYLMAGIFAEMHHREGMFEAKPENTVTRQQRRLSERNGKTLPDNIITRISLADLGRKHLDVIRMETSPSEDGQQRRAHWVRGHMFLARNGALTWRKPHIRGIGSVTPKDRVITSEEQHDPPEP